MAYSGTGKPVFKIYTSAGVAVEDFTLVSLTARERKPIRVATKYETIFSRKLVDEFIGYRFVWELTFTWKDVFGDIDDYSNVTTDIRKLQQIQEYFDSGSGGEKNYKVYLVPHADAEGTPYNQIFQVECEIIKEGKPNGGTVFADEWTMRCTTVELQDTVRVTYITNYVVDESGNYLVDELGNKVIGRH